MSAVAIFVGFAGVSCVSVNLPTSGTKKAENVVFDSPALPYQRVKDANTDGLWQDVSNGATISYYSECFNSVETSLDNILQDVSSSLSDREIVSSEEIDYNSRRGLRSRIRGKMDGVPTKIELVLFKKNNCTYTLSFVAVDAIFDRKIKDFDRFIKSFRAP